MHDRAVFADRALVSLNCSCRRIDIDLSAEAAPVAVGASQTELEPVIAVARVRNSRFRLM